MLLFLLDVNHDQKFAFHWENTNVLLFHFIYFDCDCYKSNQTVVYLKC